MTKSKLAVLLLAMVAFLYANSFGPPTRHTGGFGEPTCQSCHEFAGEAGTFNILGVPEQYSPGMTYPIMVEISQPGQMRWGFQLAARFMADGVQAGTFELTDPMTTQITPDADVQFVSHTSVGTYEGTPDGPVAWTFNWTAPPEGSGPVQFNAAGNAANGDTLFDGDFIYSREVVSMPARGVMPPPDLAPVAIDEFTISDRLGGPTLEFSVLTANIGRQDWARPRDPADPTQYLFGQMYEYVLYHERDGELVEIDRRRNSTVCADDDLARGSVFPCIQGHGAQYTCDDQGISRGWADDLSRASEEGQAVLIGPDNVGRFMLTVQLDPDLALQQPDLPLASRDGVGENNCASVSFTWDGVDFLLESVALCSDPATICPTGEEGSRFSGGGKRR